MARENPRRPSEFHQFLRFLEEKSRLMQLPLFQVLDRLRQYGLDETADELRERVVSALVPPLSEETVLQMHLEGVMLAILVVKSPGSNQPHPDSEAV